MSKARTKWTKQSLNESLLVRAFWHCRPFLILALARAPFTNTTFRVGKLYLVKYCTIMALGCYFISYFEWHQGMKACIATNNFMNRGIKNRYLYSHSRISEITKGWKLA